jgi:hypothetical protein
MNGRHEIKLSINHGEHLLIANRLKSVLQRDKNAGETGEYRVRSIYFDTPDDRALHEKLSSDDRREKFRIRRYPGHGDLLNLEKKVKIHGLCSKSSALLTRSEYERIINRDTGWMISDERPLVAEFYSKLTGQLLSPKTVIDYKREPYVFPTGNVRITFDRDIRSSIFLDGFLDDDMALVPSGDEIVVMEVKYDAFLPAFIANLIQIGNRQPAACSKYAIGRIYA